MMSGLAALNSMGMGPAIENLLHCCGSLIWAHKMSTSRPFPSEVSLHENADLFWSEASYEDKLEAFDAHPRIGNQEIGSSTPHEKWSAQEQQGVGDASDERLADFRAKNLEYEQKFGFTFIVCATGKSADEMYDLLTQRLERSLDEEAEEASEQQRQIMHLRLDKLLQELDA